MPRAKKADIAAVETAVTAAAVKKTPARRAAKKIVIPDTFVIQNSVGQGVSYKDVIKKVNDVFDGAIETLDVYVKADEAKAYYVINGDVTGSVDLF